MLHLLHLQVTSPLDGQSILFLDLLATASKIKDSEGNLSAGNGAFHEVQAWCEAWLQAVSLRKKDPVNPTHLLASLGAAEAL